MNELLQMLFSGMAEGQPQETPVRRSSTRGEKRSAQPDRYYSPYRPRSSDGEGFDLSSMFNMARRERLGNSGPAANLASLLASLQVDGYTGTPEASARGVFDRQRMETLGALDRVRQGEELDLETKRAQLDAMRRSSMPRPGAGSGRMFNYGDQETSRNRAAMSEALDFADRRRASSANANNLALSNLELSRVRNVGGVRNDVLQSGVVQELIRSLLNG